MTSGHPHDTRSSSTARWASLLALCAAAFLSACGGDDDGGGTPSDTTPPTVAVTDDVASGAASGDIVFSFTFSEDVGTSFTAADVTASDGTKGAFTKASATLYRLVVTPPANSAGDLTVTVPIGSFMDLAGNANTAAGSGEQAYDTLVALTQMELPVTFDSATVEYGLVGFGGADDSTVVVDPTNAANHVAKVVKSATAETWAGTTVTAGDGAVQLGFAVKLPIDDSNTRMTVRVWSPDAGIPVRLKAEDHTNPGITVETEATTTLASTWETLTFDFADEAAGTAALDVTKSYDKVSIFFNFGVAGATAGEKTYYFDDLVWIGGGGTGGGGGGPVDFATITFDDIAITYGTTDFGGNASLVVVDPTNAANKVVRAVKTGTAEPWAGTTMWTGANDRVGKIPLDAANTRMTVRVWSPHTGIQIRLKAEDAADPTHSVETEATFDAAANTWQTLTFDFASPASGTAALNPAYNYDRLSIFFNFGTTGATAGERTYYFDDVTFIGGTGGGGGGPTPFATVTFDDTALTYTLTGFGGAEDSTVVVDPTNAANKVARVLKSATAELWAGTTVSTLANLAVGKIPFDASNTRMTVRVWSPDSGIPVRLKVENAANNTITCETEATTTVAGNWETLTFDFASQAAGTAALDPANTYDKTSIFFNFGTTGATAGAKTYYFDDVTFIGGTGGGGGGGGTFDTITFESGTITYTLTGFGGAEDSAVVVDPTDGANHVARVVKSATAELWAGTTVSTGANFSIQTIPFSATKTQMTVRVWSPDAGIAVRLKVEDAADPTRSCETEAAVTTAAGWQTLTFDFANQAAGTAALNLAYTFNKASIFFNFGTTGATAGAKTYYFDDVAFVP